MLGYVLPETRYARAGTVHIAYQVVGDGPIDLVLVSGFASHLELGWEPPTNRSFYERLASFSRLILFDKRGTGLSDPVDEVPTLEQRMDDVRAVMDAVGSQRAALFGVSEGAPMAILFAATYPERTTALVLHGGMARSVEAPDYPYAPPRDAVQESMEMLSAHFYEGASLEVFAPSIADDPGARAFTGRFLRNAASPAVLGKLAEMFLDIDVRAALPAISAPTLITHRRGDRAVNVRASRYLAEHIRGARIVEVPGIDHLPWVGDQQAILDEVEEFLTGQRGAREPDRVLATVMFTDIVGSTERASQLGDARWRDLLASQEGILRDLLDRFRGREVKTLGDGIMATFDGPARAIRCGAAIAGEIHELGVEVRVGIHTGEVEVVGQDIAGLTVHIAARVGALAGTGEVLVSRTVKDLVAGSGIAFTERGTHRLKGITDDWQLYAVASL